MSPVVHNNPSRLHQHRFSKIGLIVLLVAMTIGLAFWLYNIQKKKDQYRKNNQPNSSDTAGSGKNIKLGMMFPN
jgi:hypothetical protein